MIEIHKYKLNIIQTHQDVMFPVGAEIIAAANVNNELCIYAYIDMKEDRRELRHFEIYATGHPINSLENLVYIGSPQFILDNNLYIPHVHEKIK